MHTNKIHCCRHLSLIALLALCAACGSDAPPVQPAAPAATKAAPPPAATKTPVAPLSPQTVFWQRLSELCGQAYAGFLTVGTEEGDRKFGEADLKMHVNFCDDNELHIPFHVSEDRSRTFIIQRGDDGLTLTHRHLDANGDIFEPHGYGGATRSKGSAKRQEFIVNEATKSKLPATQYNVWALELVPGKYLAYELKRVEEDRYFRVEFDLTEQIDTPPPPWGEDGA